MATKDNKTMQYQRTSKMFYSIVMNGVLKNSVENREPLTAYAKRLAFAYVTLCRVTGSWNEDEQYKKDPRWKS